MGSGTNYDAIITTKLDVVWDDNKIDELGKKVHDITDAKNLDLSNYTQEQQSELNQGIESVRNMFVLENGMYKFNAAISALGGSALPTLISEIQSFGRAIVDITATSKKFDPTIGADAKTAMGYRTVTSVGNLLKEISKTSPNTFLAPNGKSLYGDVVNLVSNRFSSLAKTQNTPLYRSNWQDTLSQDKMLIKQITALSQANGHLIKDEDIVKQMIREATLGIGTRSMILENTINSEGKAYSAHAPKFEKIARQYSAGDVFGHKAIKELVYRNGEHSGATFVQPKGEKGLAFSGGIYGAIKNMQRHGNQYAQDLALETGLAEMVETDEGLRLAWNKAPEQERIRKFLARAAQEGLRIKHGQGIYEKNPENNYNINQALKDVIQITQAFSDRASGKNGEEFIKRYVDQADANIDLSSLSTPVFDTNRKKTAKLQNTVGRIPTYAAPLTELTGERDANGNLIFAVRSKEDMQKLVRSTGQLKLNTKKDKGLMIQESQLTHLAGYHPRVSNGSFGAGYDSKNGYYVPDHPGLLYMPVDNMWERDAEGFLLQGDQKKLTKEGELIRDAIENGATYNGKKYRYVMTNGQSAAFMEEDEYLRKIARAKSMGIGNPFEGYDPLLKDMVFEGSLSKTNKAIISNKRLATQGRSILDVSSEDVQKKINKATYAAIDLQAQRDIANMQGIGNLFALNEVSRIVDGAGLIDPSLSPRSFQVRGLGENLKGVLGNYNWKDFLKRTVVRNNKTKDNPFIEFGSDGLLDKLYMATTTFGRIKKDINGVEYDKNSQEYADAEAKQKSIIEAIVNDTQYDGKNRSQLLKEYFQDVMHSDIMLTEGMLKGPTQMGLIPKEDYVKFLSTDVYNATRVSPLRHRQMSESKANDALKKKEQENMIVKDSQGREYVKLNAQETAENIARTLAFGNGLYEVKSEEDFSTHKNVIGQQLAQAIGFSPEAREQSARLWAQHLLEMENDSYWITKDRFSQRADIQNRFLQAEDKLSFIKSDQDAIDYIKSQKEGARKMSLTHYKIPNKAGFNLAFPLLGSLFQDAVLGYGADIGVNQVNGVKTDLQWMFPKMLQNKDYLKNNLGLSDTDIKAITDDKGNVNIEQIMFSPKAKGLWNIVGRTPSALNTFSAMINLASTQASTAGLLGGGKDITMMSPDAIYRMNTGDFDGDTVWQATNVEFEMIKNLNKVNKAAKMDDKTQQELDALFEQQMKQLKTKQIPSSFGERVSEEIYNFISGQGEMGKASAVMRNALDIYHALGDKATAEDKENFMKAYNFGSYAYDKATSEGQNMGWVGDYTDSYGKMAYLAGRNYKRFLKRVGEYSLENESDRDNSTDPSIFKNRLISLNNIMDLADAVSAGKIRSGTGFDFGLGTMVDTWTQDKYGLGSEGANPVLFEVASNYAKILKGQADLSYIPTNVELKDFFENSIGALRAEENTASGPVKERIHKELEALESMYKKADKTSEGGEQNGFKDIFLTRENLATRLAQADPKSQEYQFLLRAQNIANNIPTVENIKVDTEHEALIASQMEKLKEEQALDEALGFDDVRGVMNFWRSRIGRKLPAGITAVEPYVRSATPLPVVRRRIKEDGTIEYGKTDPLIADFWNEQTQLQGMASDMMREFGEQPQQQTDTLFGTFMHEAFKDIILEDDKQRGNNQNPTYTNNRFLEKVKELWNTGTYTMRVGGKDKVIPWKDVFTGAVDGVKFKDPVEAKDWETIRKWLDDPNANAVLGKTKLTEGMRNKIINTFRKVGNNSEYFLKDLYSTGHNFEAENQIYDPDTDEFITPYGDISKNMAINWGDGLKTYYRPDLIWETNPDSNGKSWLDMYDWKPNEGGAGKSIYQMIHYASSAEKKSKAAYKSLKEKMENGNKGQGISRQDAEAQLTQEQQRWLKYVDDDGNFRMRYLIGKDYTGAGHDVVFDYQHNKDVANVVLGDFQYARDLYTQDRNSSRVAQAFSWLIDNGLLNEDDKIDVAMGKYVQYAKTYEDVNREIKEFISNPKNRRKGKEFNGKDYVKDHNQEWNYLVAKQAHNREALDKLQERLRSVNSKYNRKVRTDAEYSQFDSLYDDIEQLNDPTLIAELSAVYKDYLPYAVKDVGNYQKDLSEQEATLSNIIMAASIVDPMEAEKDLRRQLYNSKKNNVFDKAQAIVSKANLAAGSRQTLKKPFEEKFFNTGDRKGKEQVWEEAGRIYQNYSKQVIDTTGMMNTPEAQKAKQEYEDFITTTLNGKYDFDKNGLQVSQFMAHAGRYADAQEHVDKLRATERDLISKLFEDDRVQTKREVDDLTGKNLSAEDKVKRNVDNQRKKINDYIASSKMDQMDIDEQVGNYREKLSEDFLKKHGVQLDALISSGSTKIVSPLRRGTKAEDLNILEDIQRLMTKKQDLEDAVTTLNDYLNTGFKELEKTESDKAKRVSAADSLSSKKRAAAIYSKVNEEELSPQTIALMRAEEEKIEIENQKADIEEKLKTAKGKDRKKLLQAQKYLEGIDTGLLYNKYLSEEMSDKHAKTVANTLKAREETFDLRKLSGENISDEDIVDLEVDKLKERNRIKIKAINNRLKKKNVDQDEIDSLQEELKVLNNINYDDIRQREKDKRKLPKDNATDQNVLSSHQNAVSVAAEMSGLPISATDFARLQGEKARVNNKKRLREIDEALKDTSLKPEERLALLSEQRTINSYNTNAAYTAYEDRMFTGATARNNINLINRRGAFKNIERAFSGGVMQSLEDTIDSAIDSANAQVEKYISDYNLNGVQADRLRAAFGPEAIRRSVTEEYQNTLARERINNVKREASLREQLTGRKLSLDEETDIAEQSMRQDIREYRQSLLRQSRREGISDAERNALVREAWQYRDSNIDYTGYRDRYIQQREFENEQARFKNTQAGYNITDSSLLMEPDSATRIARAREQKELEIRSQLINLQQDWNAGKYSSNDPTEQSRLNALYHTQRSGLLNFDWTQWTANQNQDEALRMAQLAKQGVGMLDSAANLLDLTGATSMPSVTERVDRRMTALRAEVELERQQIEEGLRKGAYQTPQARRDAIRRSRELELYDENAAEARITEEENKKQRDIESQARRAARKASYITDLERAGSHVDAATRASRRFDEFEEDRQQQIRDLRAKLDRGEIQATDPLYARAMHALRNVNGADVWRSFLQEEESKDIKTRLQGEKQVLGVQDYLDSILPTGLNFNAKSRLSTANLRNQLNSQIEDILSVFNTTEAFAGIEDEVANALLDLRDSFNTANRAQIASKEAGINASRYSQISNEIQTSTHLTGRNLTRAETYRVNAAKLKKEREDYIAQRLNNKNDAFDDYDAYLYRMQYDDQYLNTVAARMTNLQFDVKAYNDEANQIGINARLSGRNLNINQEYNQRLAQLKAARAQEAERIRLNNGEQGDALAAAYLASFADPLLEQTARRETYFSQNQRDLSFDQRQIQTTAKLEGRGLNRDEQINLRLDQLKQERDQVEHDLRLQGRTTEADAYRRTHGDLELENAARIDQRNLETSLASQREMRLEQMQLQNDNALAQQKHQYEMQNRNLYGASRSRLANAYRQQSDIRFGLDQTIRTNKGNAAIEQKYINQMERNFQRKYGVSSKNYAGTDDTALANAQKIAEAQKNLEKYNNTTAEASQQMQKFSTPAMVMRAGLTAISDSASMLMRRLGRQMFQKALAETKRFVKEFNATMTEIQMITMKSDAQMSTLGDGLIEKAKELKISISEISKSAATLYRQGLSDEEVDSRLETISKFSKVSGTKVEDATKLITVAMNTGLVSDPQIASDIVTALGDNAATNAQQIEKGIEKAGAAAAADGTTFAELASMLTAITSTTQIGGNVAGRTINTIIGRMNKIGTNELITDENGNKISGSAVAKLLKAQGINMYDENGNKRSTYDTLYALSQKWEGMTDAEQQQMANAIAGTRQYSNFAAIMQGMSEGKVDEYMKLASNASGITDKKFEIYTKSLQASLTDLQNTWDSVIADLVDKGYVQDFIENIASIVRGVGKLIDSLGGLQASLPIIMTLLGALTGLKFGGIGALVGAAIGGLGSLFLGDLGKQEESSQNRYKEIVKNSEEKYDLWQGKISRATELKDKTNRSKEENEEYGKLLQELSVYAGIDTNKLSSSSKSAAQTVDNLTSSIDDLSNVSKEAADNVIKEAKETSDKQKGIDIANSLVSGSESIYDEITEKNATYNKEFHATNQAFNGKLWNYNKETGTYELINNHASIATQLSNDDLKILADGFVQASQMGFIPSDYASTDSKEWQKRLKSGFKNDVWEGVIKLMNSRVGYEQTGFENETTQLENLFASYISGNVPEEMIPSVSKQLAIDLRKRTNNGVYSSEDIYAVLASMYGFEPGKESDYSWNTIKKNVKDYAINKAHYTSRATELEKLGLDDVGENGIYWDKDNKRFLSVEEAQKRVDDYNNKVKHQTAVHQVKNEKGEIIGTFNAKDTTSIRQSRRDAEEYANSQYQYIDQFGNVHYYDKDGNRLTSEDDAKKAAEQDHKENDTWHASVVWYDEHGNKQVAKFETTGENKTNKEAESFFRDRQKHAYGIKTVSGKALDFNYGNIKDAKEAAAEYTKQENLRYQQEKNYWQHAYDESKYASYSYTNPLTGEITNYEAHGADEVHALKRQFQSQERALGNQVVVKDANGNVLSVVDGEDLDSELSKYNYYVDAYGNRKEHQVAQGTRQAWVKNQETGEEIYLGYGDEIADVLNQYEGHDIRAYTDFSGNMQYGTLQELVEETNKRKRELRTELESGENAITSDYERRKSSIEKSRDSEVDQIEKEIDEYYKNNGLVYNNGQRAADAALNYYIGGKEHLKNIRALRDKKDEANRKYNELLSNEESVYAESLMNFKDSHIEEQNELDYLDNLSEYRGFDKASLETSFYHHDVKNDTVTEAASEFEWLSDWIEGANEEIKAKLDNVEPADIAKAFGNLPVFVSAISDRLIQYGKSATKVVETINNQLKEEVAPNLVGHRDYFLGSAGTSYIAWQQDKKNKYALTADEMLEEVLASQNDKTYDSLLNGNRYKDVQKLLWYINANDKSQWQDLYENGEFGRLMSQITEDKAGNILSAPDDIVQQIIDFLYANGRDFGQRQVSMNEKGTKALAAFTGLTEKGWYTSFDARNRALEKNYNEKIFNPWQKNYDEAMERQITDFMPENIKESIRNAYKKANPLQTMDEYALDEFGDIHYLNDTDAGYMKEILGEELAQKIKDNKASDYEKAYASTLLHNAQGGMQGLTARDKLSGIQMIRGLSDEEFKDLWENSQSSALAYTNGFAGFSEYAYLKTKGNLSDKEQTRLQELEKEFEEFQKNAQIDVEIEGLQTLEQAGELIQGTVDNIKSLKKGGKVALEVVTKIRTEAYESGQQTAKLYSNRVSDQDAAAMAILGMSEEQFYQDRAKNIQRAKAKQQEESTINAASYAEERKALKLDEQLLRQEYREGNISQTEYSQRRKEAASKRKEYDEIRASQGYFWNEKTQSYDYDPSRIKVNYVSQQQLLNTERANKAENNLKKYYEAIAHGTPLSAEGANLLKENDEQYWSMVMAGASQRDIEAYAARMANGQRGTFMQNNGWALANLLGANWQENAATFDFMSNLRNAQSYLTGDNKDYYEKLFSNIEGGDELLKAVSGEEADYEKAREALVKLYEENNLLGVKNADEILQNRITLATGTSGEQMALRSQWRTTGADYAEAQYALEHANLPDSASVLASVLGLDEKTVKEKLKVSPEELQKALNEKVAQYYKDIALSVTNSTDITGFDASTGDLSDLKSKLEKAAESATGETKEFLQKLIDNITNAGSVIAQQKETAGDAYDEAIKSLNTSVNDVRGYQWLRENANNIFDQLGSTITETKLSNNVNASGVPQYEATTRPKTLQEILDEQQVEGFNLNDFIKGNPAVAAMMSAYSSGALGINGDQIFQQFMQNGFYGGEKTLDYYTMSAQSILGNDIFANGMFNLENIEQLPEVFDKLRTDESMNAWLGELTTKFSDLYKVLALLAEGNASGAAKVLEDINSQITREKSEEFTKYGRAAGYLPDVISKITKGGTQGAEARNQLFNQMDELGNRAKAVNEAKDKNGNWLSGKQIKKKKYGEETLSYLSEITTIPADKLANYTSEQMRDAMAVVEAKTDEEFGDAMSGLLASLHDMAPELNVDDLINIVSGGNIDFSALGIAADSVAAEVIATLQAMVKQYGVVSIEAIADGDKLSVEGFLEYVASHSHVKPRSGKGYSGSKSSGGGGGKSKTDQLVTALNHRVTAGKHDVTMAQQAEQHYQNMNNYQGYLDALNDEVAAQMNLKAIYADNIEQLKAQRNQVKEYSDDWYTLTEAIYSAEEAISDINNTIEQISSKKVTITQTKQSNEQAPLTHQGAMYEKVAAKYQSLGQFENYAAVMSNRINQYDVDIALAQAEMQEWADLMAELSASGEEGSEAWMNARTQYWTLVENEAQLENDKISSIIALNNAKVEQIKTDLANMQAPVTHEQNMLSTWGNIYQRNEQYGAYRSELSQQNGYTALNAQYYSDAIAKLKSQMSTLEEGSEAWYNARDAIFSYEEALAQATNSIDENNAAIEQSYIDEVKNAYDEKTSDISHELKMAQIETDKYDKNNDFVNYQHMLGVQLELTTDSIDAQKKSLADMEELLNSGKIKAGSAQWKTLKDEIKSVRETLAQTENDYAELERKIAQSELEHYIERFNERDELEQHSIKMIQYEETKYQSNGELTNYGRMIEAENEEQYKRRDLIQDQIDLLKKQLESAEPGSDLYKRITSEIYKMEEALASTNNTIDANTKKLEKNKKDILNVQKTLEDAINNEIKQRKQEEKNMLDGTVSVQNSILNIIRERYKKEWSLVKEDINKKKQALADEKSLINERLNARKSAMDKEDQYEKLAQLNKQIALIQSDPTRTRELKELLKEKQDLERDMAYSIAQEEANTEIERLDEESKALDQYTQYTEGVLNEMLQNANSPELVRELEEILGNGNLSREEQLENYLNFIRQNDENYKYGTEAMRTQMEQNATDALNKMAGFVETYWDEVAKIINGGAESIATFLTERLAARGVSETGISLQTISANEMYEAYVNAFKDTAEFNDEHEIVEAVHKLNEYTYKVEPTPEFEYTLGQYASQLEYMYQRPTTVSEEAANYNPHDQYSDVDYTYTEATESTGGDTSGNYTGSNGGSGGGGGTGGSLKWDYERVSEGEYRVFKSEDGKYRTQEEAIKAIEAERNEELNSKSNIEKIKETEQQGKEIENKIAHGYRFTFNGKGYGYFRSESKAQAEATAKRIIDGLTSDLANALMKQGMNVKTAQAEANANKRDALNSLSIFKEGGLVDYTGPAWVDGTKTRPEAFLDATDTENIRALLDAFNYVRTVAPIMPSADMFAGNNTTVGDINITINQAEINNDEDIDTLARRVGKAFTKQMTKQGLNLSAYAF